MELFKFIPNVSDSSLLEQGAFINKIKNVTWIERFREPGEFTITAPVSSGLKSFLPLGTLISHLDTQEVMMVENAEIDEDVQEGEPDIVLTGRSLDAWLENRIVGQDIEHYETGGIGLVLSFEPYQLAFDTSWAQATDLIRLHINDISNNPIEVNAPGFVPISNQQHIGSSVDPVDRVVQPTPLHNAVLELLAIDDFGIKIVRPNSANIDPTTTEFRIHNGVDRSDYIIFAHVQGDLKNAKYFWSNKNLKTDYFCYSTYLVVRSHSGATGYNRRVMLVDCTDIDQAMDITDITGGGEAAVGAAMYARGDQLLRAQSGKSLLSTNISQTTKYKFRKDYEVGDIVFVRGNHDIQTKMRVTEHVEFQDKDVETGYPTLSILNE